MKAYPVDPPARAADILPGAGFQDAFGVSVADTSLTARQAAEAIFGQPPDWIRGLMAMRNFIVAPLGLKRPNPNEGKRNDRVGIFPVLSDCENRLVGGLDDTHLDFRVIVDVSASRETSFVTVTTLVRTHNLLGRLYLAGVMPFHRTIVRTLLGRLAAPDPVKSGA
jgi:Protein of unknown function (DUF2867)